jgi:hypothetical protein
VAGAARPVAAPGHRHGGDDPLSCAFLLIDLALVLVVAVAMVHRPRLYDPRDRT